MEEMPDSPIDLLNSLLGVPAGEPIWAAADLARRANVLTTWLSAADLAGLPLTVGDRALLERGRRRMAALYAIARNAATGYRLEVLKGSRIARFYPAGLIRQSGDVDLVAPDAATAWSATLEIAESTGARLDSLSILTDPGIGEDVHLGISLKWPAEEPFMDKPMGADITTCAFCGDLKTVPVRCEIPEDTDLCGLFSVAEERFQHKFRVKDRLDFILLAQALEARLGEDLGDVVCGYASQLALAPELRALIRKTDEWVEISPGWNKVMAELEPLVRVEKDRRTADRPGVCRVRNGRLVGSMRTSDGHIEIICHKGVDLAVTPLGTCVLFSHDSPLSIQTWSLALEVVRDLDPIGSRSERRRIDARHHSARRDQAQAG